jgi:MFS family permease
VAVMAVYAQWNALAPIISHSHYGSAGVFGAFESCAGVGAVLGAFTALHWRPKRPLRAGMLLTLIWPVQNLALALGAPVAVVIAFTLMTGFGFSLLMIWWETALAHHIPPAALSRVSAWDWMGSLALLPVGYLVAGPLAATFGARWVLGVGSVVGLVMVAAGLLSRSVRDLGQGGLEATDETPLAVGRPPAATASAEEVARHVRIERGRVAEIPDVNPLVGVVDERRGLE